MSPLDFRLLHGVLVDAGYDPKTKSQAVGGRNIDHADRLLGFLTKIFNLVLSNT